MIDELLEDTSFKIKELKKIEKYSLLKGFQNLEIENFEEGNFPRKLFIVYNKKI